MLAWGILAWAELLVGKFPNGRARCRVRMVDYPECATAALCVQVGLDVAALRLGRRRAWI